MAHHRRGRYVCRVPGLVRLAVQRLRSSAADHLGGADHPRRLLRVPRQGGQRPLAGQLGSGDARRVRAAGPAVGGGVRQHRARGAAERRSCIHRQPADPAQLVWPARRAGHAQPLHAARRDLPQPADHRRAQGPGAAGGAAHRGGRRAAGRRLPAGDPGQPRQAGYRRHRCPRRGRPARRGPGRVPRPGGLGLRGHGPHARAGRRHFVRRPVAGRAALEHLGGVQPDRQQRLIRALHAGGDELGRGDLHPARAVLSRLDLLGVPPASVQLRHSRPAEGAITTARDRAEDLRAWRAAVKPLDPRLLRTSSAARGSLAVTVALGLPGTGLIRIQAGLLAHVLASAATGTDAAVLAGTLIALLAVLLARAAASYGGEAAALQAAAAVKSQLRRRLTDHALRLGPSWLVRHRSGEVTTLATRGLDGLDAYFARYLPQLVLACLVPVAVLIRVGFADWISAVTIGVTLPLIPVFAILVGLHTKTTTQQQWRLLARLGGHFLDVVEGLPTLKLFGRGKPQAEVIGKVTEEYRAVTMSTLRVAFLSGFVLELAAALATALVAVEVGLRLLAGHMSYQTALLVLLLTPEAYLPLRAVGAQFHASTEGAAAARQVFEILETPVPASADPKTLKTPHTHVPGRRVSLRDDTIKLSGVSLAYPGRDRQALSGVNLVIRPGDRITLAGPSGAGKSSLLALLLRFAEPTGGRIEVGGVDLASVPVGDWRRQISWVPQQPYLFTTSVAANIALGQPAATQEAIARAAQAAGAAEFIEGLPDGYATEVSERGLRLSSGQRQQIALARAFLRDAPLLLLDEPTAHLDAVSARELEQAIARLTTDRTVIQVTHSQNETRDIGRLFTLDHGTLR